MYPPSRARYSTLHPLTSLEEKRIRMRSRRRRRRRKFGSEDADSDDDDDADAPLECTQEAGDVMFVPHSWGHAVINLVETIGVASELATGNVLNGGKHPAGDAPPGRFKPPPPRRNIKGGKKLSEESEEESHKEGASGKIGGVRGGDAVRDEVDGMVRDEL